ncbi:MAG: ATP-binding protein [Chitinivibrionales bacterium]
MSFETQKNFLGKTQTLLLAEVDSERWSSWIRLGLGLAYLALATYSYMAGHLFSHTFTVQLAAVVLLCIYSCYNLFYSSRTRVKIYSFFVLVFLDVTVITIIIGSYAATQVFTMPFRTTLFSAYILVIMFTALHSRKSLSIFCGLLSIAGYSMLYFFFPLKFISEGGFYDYCVRVVFIIVATALALIISRKNFFTMNKVISSEIRYQKLVHRLPEMLFTIDAKGNFIWTNITSHVLLGIPANVMPSRNIRSFMTKPEELKLDKTEFKATFQIKDFNGALKFVDCYLQPLREGDKHLIFEGIMSDVTDREIALSQREEMVNRLYQYQKMESLGTLATGMAHDFNNILQTVGDITSLVEKETAEQETKRRMSIISESLIDAKFLISELMALGRKKPLDYKTIHVQKFFDSIIPQFCNQLGANYKMNVTMPDEPLKIQGDADYFKRVFQNLIGNARDAMPGGGTITIECSGQKHEGKSGMAVMCVTDTGTGIPAEIKDKIFDPFFTTKKPGKGTGLGLALAQRIISLHNGTIGVERTSKNGTTFRIEIPESDKDDTDIDTKAILLNRRSTTVLILDDDPKIRNILKFFLAEFKYPTCEASDLESAAQELRNHVDACDLLIIDWKLGSDNPHTVIQNLRAIKRELIVIVVSGYPPRKESIKAMNIFKWITKPYDKNQLDLEIQRALYSHSQAHAT